MQRKVLGPEHPDLAGSIESLAVTLASQGENIEAEALYREALAMRKKLHGPEHRDVAHVLNNLAIALQSQRRYAEAEALYREALAMRRKLLGPEHFSVVGSLNDLASVLNAQDNHAELESIHRERLAIIRKSPTNDAARVERRLSDLADVLHRQNKYAEAEPIYRELLQSRRARLAAEDRDVLEPTASLARLLADWAWAEGEARSEIRNPKSEIAERAREAERLLRDVLAIRLAGTNATHWRTADVKSRLGGALLSVVVTDANAPDARLAKLTEAETLLLESYNGLHENKSADSRHKREALERLVRLYEAWPDPAKAMQWKQTLAEFDRRQPSAEASAEGQSKK